MHLKINDLLSPSIRKYRQIVIFLLQNLGTTLLLREQMNIRSNLNGKALDDVNLHDVPWFFRSDIHFIILRGIEK